MEKYEQVHRGIKKIFIHNFVGGIAWGLGATVGLAAVLTILGFVISKVDIIPVVGEFVSEVIMYIEKSPKSFNFK